MIFVASSRHPYFYFINYNNPQIQSQKLKQQNSSLKWQVSSITINELNVPVFLQLALIQSVQNVMQARTTYCLYHPDEFITNFCRDKNCLMPLCPTCIGDHSQYHEQNITKPQYSSINQTLSFVQSTLYNSIYSLQQDKKRNTDLIKRIKGLDNIIHQKIITTKNIIYGLIDKAFAELENELKNSLFKLHEQIGLYSLRKSQKFDESVKEIISELYDINQGLKTQKYLSSIIIYLKDKFQQSSTFHIKINNFLEQNETYEPRMQLSNQAKNAVISNIARIIKIEGKKELDRKKQKYLQSKSNLLKNKPYNKDYLEKSQKIERSYTPQRSAPSKNNNLETSKVGFNMINASNSPYKDRLQNYKRYQNQGMVFDFQHQSTNRIRDFKQQYQILSRKVSQMRHQNELISKQAYK